MTPTRIPPTFTHSDILRDANTKLLLKGPLEQKLLSHHQIFIWNKDGQNLVKIRHTVQKLCSGMYQVFNHMGTAII